MGLHWGAPVLKSLIPHEWWDRIQSVQVDPHVPTKEEDTLNFVNGATGERMTGFTFGPFYRLRRSKLRALLFQDLDIRYDKRLTDISYAEDGSSVTAHFADGTTTTGTMLVGADGARSATRNLLLGPTIGAINRLPYGATFVQTKFSRDRALFLRKFHPLFLGAAHPSNYFAFFGMQDAAEADRPETWTFFFYISWRYSLAEQDATADWTDAQRLQQVKELSKSFAEPWKSAFEWTPDDTPVWYLGLTDWDPGLEGHRWSNHGGRVTMVGDAVHPMTYQRGQGLNHSITDAGKLTAAIQAVSGEKDASKRAETITAFEDEMIARAGEEVRMSTTNTGMLHDWESVMKSPVMTAGLKKGGE
ncbi:FAD/NAD(P)-binding domain-containing protein [Lophium mytilinum]|uniref:FAD/NAD(P)-binding domain-containing protein n=1 Tax=Lophium mytilinum TaxID=390894 RepID=A0A6A6R2I5_9PEZI|nr:FAD/NAD(P)-binding domain-containing protein [Lophium mytilinum]